MPSTSQSHQQRAEAKEVLDSKFLVFFQFFGKILNFFSVFREISKILNTEIPTQALPFIIRLIDLGYHSEAIAAAVKEFRKVKKFQFFLFFLWKIL